MNDGHLIFPVVPNIISFVPDGGRYVVNVTDPVTFQCEATGVPAPTIQWFRGADFFDPSSDPRISLTEHNVTMLPRDLDTASRTLTISNTMSSDSDTAYSCRVSSAATGGMDSETFELFVQGKVMRVVYPLS